MMEIQEKPIATTADAAEAPQTEKNESKFGDAAKDGKEQIAEDDAAAQLGDFA